MRRRDRARRADELLDTLGVANCAQRVPEQMSGGEQQRTAIATALANQPRVLLADEPTGELDTASANAVFTALQTANAELGATILVVTHDPEVSAQVRRTVAIRDGRTSSETLRHGTVDELGNAARVSVEYAVLDRAGRVQLPREMTARLSMRDRVRLQEQPGHIGVWPDQPSRPAPGRAEVADSPTAPPASALVAVRDVARTYGRGATAVHALRAVSFAVAERQLVAVRGRSGSGKTTLLNIVGGLDAPTRGTVHIAGRDVTAMTERLLLRRSTVAFIFESFGLIPTLSAAENVGVPLRITGTARRAREERVRMLLSVVGLDDHAEQRPNELSGGEQQRVAIARALARSPELLLADEPTGQLDSETGLQVMRLLQTVVRAEGITALVATHEAGIVDLADSVLTLEDGKMGA